MKEQGIEVKNFEGKDEAKSQPRSLAKCQDTNHQLTCATNCPINMQRINVRSSAGLKRLSTVLSCFSSASLDHSILH